MLKKKIKHFRKEQWKDVDVQQNDMCQENHRYHLNAPGYQSQNTKD